jgi:macrolide-specific efflux system membrane fusion protein
MKIRRPFIIMVSIGMIFCLWFFIKKYNTNKSRAKTVEEIRPDRGDIEVTISTTGTVQPQNRLEVKPPINGRVEEIPVKEGDVVKKGDVLARMSSTDRAALLDAAHSKGEEFMAYWEDVY